MSDHKHTPDRWRVAVEKTTVGEFGWTWATKIYRHDRDWGLLSIPTGEMSKVPPPPHPDALLIAAAPALRDALDELVLLAPAWMEAYYKQRFAELEANGQGEDGTNMTYASDLERLERARAALALADGQEDA